MYVDYVYIIIYIYGSNSLELGEDIELFYVVQDFCLVTVCGTNAIMTFKGEWWAQLSSRVYVALPESSGIWAIPGIPEESNLTEGPAKLIK